MKIPYGTAISGVRLTELMGSDIWLVHHQVMRLLVDSMPRFELPTLTVQFPVVPPPTIRIVGEIARFAAIIEGLAPTRDRRLDIVVRASAHEAGKR